MGKMILVLITLLPATVFCQLQPENLPRPSRKGFSTISGVCDTTVGTINSFSGREGTLKSCTDRCSSTGECKGLNFVTDQNECVLFRRECNQTQAVARDQPNQNFYLKGEIACSVSTEGNEFYLAFMANRVAKPKNMSLEIWLTQDRAIDGATVKLESHPSVGLVREINVPYKQAVSTFIPHEWKISDKDSGVTIENKALKLSSDADFVFYGVNKEYFTADAYLGIPSRALGTRYVANCHWPSYYNCEFAFTPTSDDTEITVTLPRRQTTNTGNWARAPGDPQPCALPFQGRTFTNGQSFTISLNRFQVAQIQDPCDLTGSIIESNKPIAFWSGDSRVNIGDSPSRDHQVEELFSVDTWGTDCAAWPTPNRAQGLVDYWVITAANDNTRVRIDSNEIAVKYFDLNAGESVRFPANSVREWMRFSSDKKFQAIKYASSAVDNSIPGDPAMTICIPSDQFGFGYTFVTPTGVSSPYSNYLSLITKRGNENGFVLDGYQISGVGWTVIPNSDLVGGFVQLDSSRQQFRIEHRVRGTQFEAYIYGSGDRESIAYPTGACIQALGECFRSTMFIADGKDNDCDGVVDAELFDGIDNDFDGEIDEDCYRVPTVKPPTDRCPEVIETQACQNDFLYLQCDSGNIKIIDAHFGRIGGADDKSCKSENPIDSCEPGQLSCGWEDISSTLRIQCDGRQQCSLPTDQFETSSKCPRCSLYAKVFYTCLNTKEMDNGVMTGRNRIASSFMEVSTSKKMCSASENPYVSELGDNFQPSKSAFSSGAHEGWKPEKCDAESSWLQVDLGGQYALGWYAISGCRRFQQWITEFGLSYSLNGIQWEVVTDNDGEMKLFDGNENSQTPKVCTLFEYSIVARFVRIHPFSYLGYPCAHVDFGHASSLQSCPITSVTNSNLANGGTTGAGTAVTVTCNKGWTTSEGFTTFSVRCDDKGRWAGSFSSCDNLLHCPGIFEHNIYLHSISLTSFVLDVPQINGGYASGTSNLPGARVNYECFVGYRLVGERTIECSSNGQWSSPPPTCEQL